MPSAQQHFSNRRSFAVLHADIHGYGRLMERDEDRAIERVTRSLELVRNLVSDYGGNVDNIAGDGVLALFPTTDQAVHFAIEMQRELSNEAAWSGSEETISYRIGIALGETTTGGGTLHGQSINLAARLQSIAPPGGIYLSEPAYKSLKSRTELDIRSLGKKSLKNIAEPVDVFAVAPEPAHLASGAQPWRAKPPQQKLASDTSLAVLPFENVSGDPVDAHLCLGIAADLISNLCRFRNLMVIARQSSFLVAAHLTSIRQIGRQLGVRYVLSGSLRRVGDRLRIAVDLVEAETENTVWSERYDGSLADILAFQDAVTGTTAARLAVQIDMAEKRRLSLQAPRDFHAYGLILRGQDLSFRFRPESNAHARRLFEQAREIDPQYGRSYAAISRTYNVEWRYNWAQDPDAALNEALELAQLAVEHDDLDARGFSELGLAHLYKKQHDESLAAYERALELNPNDADLLAEMGDCLVYVRQPERAVQLINQAIKLNPYHPDSYLWYLGDAYFHLGDYEKTVDTVRRMRDQSEGHRLLAASYALLGRTEEARREAEAVKQAHPNFTIEQWRKVPPNKFPEDLEVFVKGLRKAGLR